MVSATSPGTPAAQPPQRLCPRCSTIARTVEPECPFFATSSTRRRPCDAAAAAVLLAVATTLAGLALMLSTFGDALDEELDDQVQVVERDFDREVRGLERRILRELDERLPATPTVPPGG